MSIWSRAKHLGYRIAQETKEYPARLKEYGFKVAGVTFVDGIIPPGKHSIYIRTRNSDIMPYQILYQEML